MDRCGTKVKVDRPESEWVTIDAPELRIVSEELWRAAHARLKRTRQAYLRAPGGRLWGRPEARLESRYLLTGFIVCASCEGSFLVRNQRSGGRPASRVHSYYACTYHRCRGSDVCRNGLTVPMERANAAVLETLRADVLTPEAIELTVRKALRLYTAEPGAAEAERERLTKQLRQVEAECARLTDAVAAGDALPPLLEALRARERRRAELHAHLEHLEGMTRAAPRLDRGVLVEEARQERGHKEALDRLGARVPYTTSHAA